MDVRQLAQRREFDLRVLHDMRCDTFDFEAYRSRADLDARRRQVPGRDGGADVTHYRWIFRVRTHISKDRFAPVTEIGVNTDVTDYPRLPPLTWIISSHVPWSPHFMAGAPVCIGDELWAPTGGHITLGELAIHVARLLNWDEKGRGSGYVGWNGEAIEYHRRHYRGRPINPNLRYPVLPTWLTGEQSAEPTFHVMSGVASWDPGFRTHR
jgi:hypothetical protein